MATKRLTPKRSFTLSDEAMEKLRQISIEMGFDNLSKSVERAIECYHRQLPIFTTVWQPKKKTRRKKKTNETKSTEGETT